MNKTCIRWLSSLLAGVCLPGVLAGCAKTTSVQDALYTTPAQASFTNYRVEEAFHDRLESFGFTSASLLLAESKGNENYSPISLYMALAVLANGAEGDTQALLLDTLGTADLDELNRNSQNLLEYLQREYRNEKTEVSIANSVWIAEQYKLQNEYTESVATHLYADVYSVNFANGEGDRLSGEWVKEKTHGTLAPSFSAPPDMALRLLNALYIKGNWEYSFSESRTEEGTFTLAGNDTIQTDFMNQTISHHHYAEGKNFTSTYLPIDEVGHMQLLLPKKGFTVEDLLAEPDALSYTFEADLQDAKVIVSMPKFEFKAEYDLENMMQEIGLGELFIAPQLGGILKAPAAPAVSQVQQGTCITVDEDGLEASSYTSFTVPTSGMPGNTPKEKEVEIILDKPFLYRICAADGTTLFIGIMRNPKES